MGLLTGMRRIFGGRTDARVRSETARGAYYGKYRGRVVDTADPEGRGRLRVRVPAVLGKDVSDWALPCAPYGGSALQGMFFIPDVDADVWVEFEAGDVQRPIWAGTYWQEPQEFAALTTSGEPVSRSLRTAAGHVLQFDDEAGAERILLRHSSDAEVTIDSDGTVVLTDASGARLVMDAEHAEIRVEDASGNVLTMNSAGTRVEDAHGHVIEMAPAGISVEATKIVLRGDQVHLGGEGGEPLIKGQSFLEMFATHIHTTAPVVGGPTSPPIPQGEASALSTVVKSV